VTPAELAQQWVADVEAADAEAHRSSVAFTTGRFQSYLAERAAEAQARLDAIYDGPADEPNDSTAAGSHTTRGDGE